MEEDFADRKERINLMRKGKEIQELVQCFRWSGNKIAKLLIKFPITANQLTVFSLFLGIITAILFASKPAPLNIALAALLLQLTVLTDYVDGEVARAKKQTSIFGKWLDYNIDELIDILIFLGISWGIYYQNLDYRIWLLAIAVIVLRTRIVTLYSSVLLTIPTKYRKEIFDPNKNFVFKSWILRQFILTRVSMFFLGSVLAIISIFQPEIYGKAIMLWYMVFIAAYSLMFYLAIVVIHTIKIAKIHESDESSEEE